MKVYVIMGNDYPDAVYETEESADQYVKQKKKDQLAEIARRGYPVRVIHWRSYEFELLQ